MASRHPEGKNTNESEPQIPEEIKISGNEVEYLIKILLIVP